MRVYATTVASSVVPTVKPKLRGVPHLVALALATPAACLLIVHAVSGAAMAGMMMINAAKYLSTPPTNIPICA